MVNGKRICKSTGKTIKREARSVEHAERQKVLNKSKLTPQEQGAKTLLLTAVENTYEQRWIHNRDGLRTYKRAVNLAAIIGNVPLSDITDTVVFHLTKTLQLRGSKPATINHYLSNLKTILKGHKQPVDAIKLRKTSNGRIRVLSKEEEVMIVNLLKSERGERRYYFPDEGDLVEVLAASGLRLGEALSVTYEDIDLESNLLTVWVNKGNRPRSIPMTKRVRSILKSRQASNPVKPFSMKSYQVSTAWNWARKEMGLGQDKQFVPHALRHSFCSRLIAKGVGLPEVQLLMGHADISTSMIYMHLDPRKLASAISALED